MITILQNFVISKQERLDTLANEILPDVADFFSECDFCINYNSTENLEIVQSLYEKHVDKLSFYFNPFLNIRGFFSINNFVVSSIE